MAEIELPCGRKFLIDDADLPLLEGYNLYARKVRDIVYVNALPKVGSGKKRLPLHKVITGYRRTDHKNGDGLDNRRENLRPCTHAENMRNSRKKSTAKNPFKGVFWHAAAGRWMAQIKVDLRAIYGGLFDDPEAAARAYDALAVEHHGEFARLNFPNE